MIIIIPRKVILIMFASMVKRKDISANILTVNVDTVLIYSVLVVILQVWLVAINTCLVFSLHVYLQTF